MRLSKKIAALFLAAAMAAVSLSACVYDAPAETDKTETEATDKETTTEEAYNYSSGITADGYWEGVKAADYVTLPTLTGIEIPADTHTVSDDKVQEQIDSLVASLATTSQVKDRAVADGDTINIDYVGKIDGVEFENGSTNGAGTSVTIGTTNYIPGFLDKIVGHMPGETFDVPVTFPDPYETNTDLSGKAAVFTTTINYIEVKTTPELSDELVNTNFASQYGWTTVEQMRTEIKDDMQKSNISSFLKTYLLDNSTFAETLPQTMIDYQNKSLIQYYTQYASQYGTDLTTMLSYMGYTTTDELVAAQQDAITKQVKSFLITQAIADQQGLVATDENVKAYFLTNMGSEDYSTYTSTYGDGYIKMVVLQSLTMTYVTDNSVKL